MSILPAPPSDWKRPGTPPLHVQVKVLLRQLGLAGKKVNWDHRPPVSERKFNTITRDTIPSYFDPEHLFALDDGAHDKLTNGPGGEKRITTLGSDTHNRKRRRNLAAEQAEFVRRMLHKRPGEKRKCKGRIPSRGFAKGHRPMRSRNDLKARRRQK